MCRGRTGEVTVKMFITGIIHLMWLSGVIATQEDPENTFDLLYNSGVTAYRNDRWFECKQFMQLALSDFKFYTDTLAQCRIKCEIRSKSSIDQKELPDLFFFDIVLQRSDCLRRCKARKFKGRPEGVTGDVQKLFRDGKPYDYLQICAFKSQDYELAGGAAFTYYIDHQESEHARENMKFYQKSPHMRLSYFKNLESHPHNDNYMAGVDTYGKENFWDTINNMERALRDYYKAYKKCSALCEEPHDHESFPEFYNAVADHYIKVLTCKQQCPNKLATILGNRMPQYVPEHYNYLQYSYYKLGNLEKAAECVASYQLFLPSDETMEKNRLFYLDLEDVTEKSFTPRQEALEYFHRQKEEAQLLMFVEKRYLTHEKAVDLLDEPELDEDEDELMFQNPLKGEKDHIYQQSLEAFHASHDLTLVFGENDLHGEDRFLLDGLIPSDDCEKLIHLSEVASNQVPSPEVISFGHATQLAKNGSVTEDEATALLNAAAAAKHYLERYINLLRPLYFKHTQLLCSSATQEPDISDSWSVPVQADSCTVKEDGSCKADNSERSQNAYSAVLFLNGDFEGGKFSFVGKEETPETSIIGRCGRLLGYNSRNKYRFNRLDSGKACRIHMTYTLSEKNQDQSYSAANMVLATIATRKRYLGNPALKTMLDEKKLKISLAEDELNGTDRFVAQDLLSEEECEALVKLANTGAVSGDGYAHTRPDQGSPHTDHEHFEGLTLMRAAQLAQSSEVDTAAVQLYLDASEKARGLTETYFHLNVPLYFDYTHLVCRTALDDSNKDREDLSHPVHSDNCHIQPDGSCPRKPPAYAERDYSALLYLNGNFEGGEFFFAHKNLSVQAQLKPKCGMLVGFDAGNYHGVKAVLSGQRCAVAMWYTLDQRYNEQAHGVARTIVSNIIPQGPQHGEL